MYSSRATRFSFIDWFVAARPKTLTTALVPFLAGTFLAFADRFTIAWSLMAFACLSAICIQIGTNFMNDAYDFKRGADRGGVLGPERASRAGLLSGQLTFRHVWLVGALFFSGAVFFAIPLFLHGGPPVILIIALSILAGFLYTGGPFPLAYHGLGDLFVLLFYGGVATNAAYWLQSGEINARSALLSVQVGCLCTSMIAINNLRDVEEDAKASKNTLPVRFGILFGKLEIMAMLAIPLVLNLFWPWQLAAWLPWLSAPIAIAICMRIWKLAPSNEYNGLLAISGANMLFFCLLLMAGFALT